MLSDNPVQAQLSTVLHPIEQSRFQTVVLERQRLAQLPDDRLQRSRYLAFSRLLVRGSNDVEFKIESSIILATLTWVLTKHGWCGRGDQHAAERKNDHTGYFS